MSEYAVFNGSVGTNNRTGYAGREFFYSYFFPLRFCAGIGDACETATTGKCLVADTYHRQPVIRSRNNNIGIDAIAITGHDICSLVRSQFIPPDLRRLSLYCIQSKRLSRGYALLFPQPRLCVHKLRHASDMYRHTTMRSQMYVCALPSAKIPAHFVTPARFVMYCHRAVWYSTVQIASSIRRSLLR